MSKSFLQYVAEDLLAKYGRNMSRVAVVFPGKRASLFLNDYLAQASGSAMWSPAMLTISDLFRSQSHLRVADELRLVCELYPVFNEQTSGDEPLDEFYGWGKILLADFDDVDKNLVDASQLYANLASWHEMDTADFLTPEQVEALKAIFSDFSADHTALLRKKFLTLWSHLGAIYEQFNRRLASKGLCYEGALYRKVVEQDELNLPYYHYVFVGFNALTRVEHRLFSLLKREGKATFYWDFDRYYMKDHEAGQFIAQYLKDFPCELPIDNADIYGQFARAKQITFVSAGTEHMQARYMAPWLKANQRIDHGRQTAIVLLDEQLLPTAIHCWPPEATACNVTMGYPLCQAPVASLISSLLALQTKGYDASRDCFRLSPVRSLLRHPYISFLTPNAEELLAKLAQEKKFFLAPADLAIDEGLQLLFGQVCSGIPQLLAWLIACVERVGVAGPHDDAFFALTIHGARGLLTRLHLLATEGLLAIDTTTLVRLVGELLSQGKVPFHGEPIEGIQLMGLLETRNLDFNHLLILSASEGTLPEKDSISSFIPMVLRTAFGMTTPGQREAITSYYFHRLLQRATDITICFNNATYDMHRGERSRFLSQLLVEDNHHQIAQFTLHAPHAATTFRPKAIAKTPEIMQVLRHYFEYTGQKEPQLLSPSAIKNYLHCPLTFYYRYVKHLREPDSVDTEDIDPRSFGKVFHKAAELFYLDYINRQVDNSLFAAGLERRIRTLVDNAFMEIMNLGNIDLNGRQTINREVIISYLKRLATVDSRTTPFGILGLEEKVSEELFVPGAYRVMLGGYIDRRDFISTPEGRRMRVVDYKTGRESNTHPKEVEQLFMADDNTDSPNYLQAMIYCHIVSHSPKFNPEQLPVSPALFYVHNCSSPTYDPTLSFDKEPITDIRHYDALLMEKLIALLTEIFAPEGSFQPTENTQRCEHCTFKKLCESMD